MGPKQVPEQVTCLALSKNNPEWMICLHVVICPDAWISGHAHRR
jgi:hypothetical protein